MFFDKKIVGFFIFIILLLPLFATAAKKEVSVVTSNFPPYSFSKDGQQFGYLTELVKYLLKEQNINVPINELPYKRAVIKALNKPNTIIYPIIKTKENEHQFYWLGQISHQQINFFKNKKIKEIKIDSLKDLKRYHIGVRRGSFYIKYLKDRGINKVEEVDTNIQNILKLSLSRVDLILQEELTFLHTLEEYNKSVPLDKQINFDDFEKISSSIFKTTNPIFIAINRQSDKKLVEKLKDSFEKNMNRNKLLEVAHWWTEKSHEKMVSVYKQALEKQGYFWVDYTFEGGAGEKMQKVLNVREKTKKRPHALQIYLGPAMHELAKKNILLNLNEVAKKEHWKEKLPSFVNQGIQYKGNYFAVPVNMQRVNLIWINPKVFKLANAKIPTTWEEFYTAAKKIKKAGLLPVSIGSEAWEEGTLFENLVLSLGGVEFYKKALVNLDISAINSATMINIFKNFRKIQQLTSSNKEGKTWVDATTMVANGEAGMYFMGDWAKGIFKDAALQYSQDYLSIPTFETQDIFLNNTDVFVFPKVTNNNLLAQKALATVIMKKEIQKEFNLAKGSLPAYQNISLKDFDEVSKVSMNTIKKGKIIPSFNFRQTTSKKIHDEVVALISKFFNSNMTEEHAVKELVEIYNINK